MKLLDRIGIALSGVLFGMSLSSVIIRIDHPEIPGMQYPLVLCPLWGVVLIIGIVNSIMGDK